MPVELKFLDIPRCAKRCGCSGRAMATGTPAA